MKKLPKTCNFSQKTTKTSPLDPARGRHHGSRYSRFVCAREPRRFTTARVADEAGISIGSLYQYFPNKESILFKLQTDEWTPDRQFSQRHIVRCDLPPPFDRLRRALRLFFKSECEEAQLRVALADAAPLYRHAPESLKHRSAGLTQAIAFLAQALAPRRSGAAGILRRSSDHHHVGGGPKPSRNKGARPTMSTPLQSHSAICSAATLLHAPARRPNPNVRPATDWPAMRRQSRTRLR